MFLPVEKKPQPIEVKQNDSPIIGRWQNIGNWQFRSLCFAIGTTAANFARSNPQYFWLYVVGIAIGSLSLMLVPPSDLKYQGLWRTAGAALFMGALVTWWDLLMMLQWWHFVGFGVGAVFTLFAIGSGGNRR